MEKSPDDWNAALQDLQFLEAIDSDDDIDMQHIQERLQIFVREMRSFLCTLKLIPGSARVLAERVLDFIGVQVIRRAFPIYQRQQDFERVWNGFILLLQECSTIGRTWAGVIDEFEGMNQITLMTIHKSKGLEFHTMIFCGLDNKSWWSLSPDRVDELNSFFVALTRACQRAIFTLCSGTGRPVAWVENLLLPVGVKHEIKLSVRQKPIK